MAKIERFEDLNCWKESRELVRLIFTICQSEKLSRDYALVDQLKRASISVMNNIAEGFGRYSNKEFIRFLDFSQSSAQELMSMSYILLDMNYIDNIQFEKLQLQITSSKNMVLGLVKYLKTKIKTVKP